MIRSLGEILPFARSLRAFVLASMALAFAAAPAGAGLTTGALTLDANFHTISVRAAFTTTDAAAGNDATIEYRRVGEIAWRNAPPAWIDVRATLAFGGGAANWARNEARGKIFGVAPAVDYEVRVTFSGAVTGANPITGSVATRDLTPPAPALRTLHVSAADGNDSADGLTPSSSKRTIAAAFAIATAGDRIYVAPGVYVHTATATLAASGTPAQWIRLTKWPAMSGDVIVEGNGPVDSVVNLTGSYIRVDGLTIRKGTSCLRVQGGTTDHWIDGNVITDWNSSDDGTAAQHRAGIAAWSNATRLVVMDNLLKRRDVLAGTQHGGGNGIWLRNRTSDGTNGGHHVVRRNTIIGGYDGIGSEAENEAHGGFHVNSDVYENLVTGARDDCIQMEGADLNCAVFANTIRRGLIGIAWAPNGVGPLFVMRNRHLGPTWSAVGGLYKVGDATDARTWIYHESGYNPDSGLADAGDGMQQTNPGLTNFVSRNNAWHVDRYVVETTTTISGTPPSMDYDALFTTDASGRFIKWYNVLRSTLAAFQSSDGQEPNGLERDLAALDWVSADDGNLRLGGGSVLEDAGLAIPGVNSDVEDASWNFIGTAPDIGALEAGGGDAALPDVAITSPDGSGAVSGTATVTASATDDTGVILVELFIDGTLAAADMTAPYTFTWTTTTVIDGLHTLEARAHDAASNVARSAEIEVPVDNDHGGVRNAYGCYKAKSASGTPRFEQREVTVTDQFGVKDVTVIRSTSVCNPASRDGAAIVDPSIYLTCYKAKDAGGQARFVPRDVELADAFGAARWTLRKPSELCVRSVRDADPPPPILDAYRCYKAKTAGGEPKFAQRNIAIADDFGTMVSVVLKPVAFCTPADDGGGSSDPDGRLACYKIKNASGQAPFTRRDVVVRDAFGDQTLTALKGAMLCVPADEAPGP